MLNLNQKRILIIDKRPAIHEDIRNIILNIDDSASLDVAHASPSQQVGLSQQEVIWESQMVKSSYVVDSAYEAKEGIQLVRQAMMLGQPYALAFVEVGMNPEMDGVRTAKRILELDPDVQIIICTTCLDHSWTEISKQLGYSENILVLKKPFQSIEVRQFVIALAKKWEAKINMQFQLQNLEYLVDQRTVDLKRSLEQISYQVTHDQLTSLPNRTLLIDRIQQAISFASSYDLYVCILFFDLNHLKNINNSWGLNAGDYLIKEFAKRLRRLVTDNNTIARLEGDLFAVVINTRANESYIISLVKQFLTELEKPYMLKNQLIVLTASVGISIYPLHGKNVDVLLKNADSALQVAKKEGRNTYKIFQSEFNQNIQKRVKLESGLFHALDRHEFVLYYQPIIELKNNKICGVEAMLRWKHPLLGLILPDSFIPIAEETGLIIPITNWVLKQACLQTKAWMNNKIANFRIAVNLSDKYFHMPEFIDSVEQVLHETEFNPDLLEFELTENAIVQTPSISATKMLELKNMGIHLVMDNFGTGNINLNYLKHFPFEKVKIDKSIIQKINERTDESAIIEAIIAMLKGMGVQIVAHGVETYGQLNFLRMHASDQVQGYIFHKPLNAEECSKVLESALVKSKSTV